MNSSPGNTEYMAVRECKQRFPSGIRLCIMTRSLLDKDDVILIA